MLETNNVSTINTRIPLVLFTGGMDSTVILKDVLRKGNCDVLYVNIGQSKESKEKELQSRQAIIAALSTDKHRVLNQHEVTIPDIAAEHMHELARATKLIYAAHCVMDPQRHGSVVIGGILGDETILQRDKVSKLWMSLTGLSKWKPAPLEFPLAQQSKRSVLELLGEQLVPLTTYCELSSKEPCKVCSSCKTLALAVAEYRRSSDTVYA